jgi:hypothetical protein
VRVVKDGFRPSETETVNIAKGQEAVVKFTLVPVERLAALVLDRMTPGTQVSVDDAVIGKVGSDGRLSHNGITPGRHTVLLTLPGYEPMRVPRDFPAGEPVNLSGLALLPSDGSLEIVADPTTNIAITRGGQVFRRVTGSAKLSLPAGSYSIAPEGSAGVSSSSTVTLAAGESKTVDLRSVVTGPELFDAPQRWVKNDRWFIRRGGGFVLYNSPRPIGRFSFTTRLPRGSRFGIIGGTPPVRWVVGYTDPRNYVHLQIDDRSFSRYEVIDGKRQAEQRSPHNIPQNAQFVHVHIEVKANQIEHQVSHDGKDWRVLDTWTPPPRGSLENGRFGFYLPGDDEIAISNFEFHPAGER